MLEQLFSLTKLSKMGRDLRYKFTDDNSEECPSNTEDGDLSLRLPRYGIPLPGGRYFTREEASQEISRLAQEIVENPEDVYENGLAIAVWGGLLAEWDDEKYVYVDYS
jgi:hypothetical protein